MGTTDDTKRADDPPRGQDPLRIVRGCADGSYGIEVAKLAGVPDSVVERAKVVLKEITEASGRPIVFENKQDDSDNQIVFGASDNSRIIEKLRGIDINTLTPIESMQILYELISMAD